MAWIETVTGYVVNLDNIEYINTGWEGGDLILWANGESGHPIYSEESSGHKDQGEKFYRLMKQIAQVARSNAYISQDDIRRMMDNEILDK